MGTPSKTFYAIKHTESEKYFAGYHGGKENFRDSHYWLYDEEVAIEKRLNMNNPFLLKVVVSPVQNDRIWRD